MEILTDGQAISPSALAALRGRETAPGDGFSVAVLVITSTAWLLSAAALALELTGLLPSTAASAVEFTGRGSTESASSWQSPRRVAPNSRRVARYGLLPRPSFMR